jgi:esterase/lipase superfamily enzyme
MRIFRTPQRLLSITLLAAAMGLAACTRPPELIGIENPDMPAEAVEGITRHRIFITTTRTPSDAPGVFLTSDRARALGLGSVEVTIPPMHQLAQLERPRQLPPDPTRHFTVVTPVRYESDRAFIAAIDRELATRPPEDRTLLLFVHGFNNTPTDALLRLGQFVEDSGFKGVPVLLTWASAARTLRYVYDLNSALIAREMLPQIGDILLQTQAHNVDVFAHSMGSLLVMEGLVERERIGARGRGRLDTVMLAAPDIDIDLFRTHLDQLSPETRSSLFVLISERDQALRVSARLAGGVPRLGATPLEELEEFGLTIIDLSAINDSTSGTHSKFAGSPEVVQLIGAGLNTAGRFDDDNTPLLDQILTVSPIRILRNATSGGN